MHGCTYIQHFTQTLNSTTGFSPSSWTRRIKQRTCQARQTSQPEWKHVRQPSKINVDRVSLLSEATCRNAGLVWGERAAQQASGSAAKRGFIPAALGGSGCLCHCCPEAAGAAHPALVPRHTAHQQHRDPHVSTHKGHRLLGAHSSAHRRLGHYRKSNHLSFGSFKWDSCNENATLSNATSCWVSFVCFGFDLVLFCFCSILFGFVFGVLKMKFLSPNKPAFFTLPNLFWTQNASFKN